MVLPSAPPPLDKGLHGRSAVHEQEGVQRGFNLVAAGRARQVVQRMPFVLQLARLPGVVIEARGITRCARVARWNVAPPSGSGLCKRVGQPEHPSQREESAP